MAGKSGSMGSTPEGYIPPIQVVEVPEHGFDNPKGRYRVYKAEGQVMEFYSSKETERHNVVISANLGGTAQEIFDELRKIQALVNLALSIYGEVIKK
jgi:hypothetical protein